MGLANKRLGLTHVEAANRHSGGNDGGGDLEARVRALEDATIVTRDRLARIEVRLENCATREDLHREIGAATSKYVTWLISIFSLYVVVMSGIMALLLKAYAK